MDKNQLKVLGAVCLVICCVCVFVAIERNNANAATVQAMNSFGGGLLGGNLKPAMPAATKYALFFALLSGIGGGMMLAKSKKDEG